MIKIESNCTSRMSEQEMWEQQGQGIEYLAVNFIDESPDSKTVLEFQKRAEKYGLKISNAGCPALQKCASIHLGKEDRDLWIEKYNNFTQILGEAGIPVNYLAWQPNGIFRSGIGAGKFNRGQNSFLCNMEEIKAKEIVNDRYYGEKEIWDNFQYFLEKALPICEKSKVGLALHPNDPPVPEIGGVACLIWNTECYRRAFALSGDSPYLVMKMCIGCWLESEQFGNLYQDIDEFVKKGKIPIIHFRNVSGTMPYFEETLMEDGYADMYDIMKHIVYSGFDGFLNIDHPFFDASKKRFSAVSAAYDTGYMKALLHCAERECCSNSKN